MRLWYNATMSASKTILIVEDNLDSRQIYSEILRDENFNVVETEHGKEALEYLETHSDNLPHLIVMDLTFPHMTAKEFVAGLNSRIDWKGIPLLVISGQVDIKEISIELKAKGYLRKPFNMDPFVKAIKNLV
jgi:CheY-like chemotaxis protein